MYREDSDPDIEFPNLHRQLVAGAVGRMTSVYSAEDLKGMDPKVAALLVEQETVRQKLEHELRLRELDAQRERETNQLELRRLENEAQQNAHRLGQRTEGHVKGPKVPNSRRRMTLMSISVHLSGWPLFMDGNVVHGLQD